MALLLDQIAWGEPLLPAQSDPAWEAEIRRRGAHVSEVDRRIAPCHWLREVSLDMTSYRPVLVPKRMAQIGAMVTSQENACRYCYGANRAFLKVLGYSEHFIRRIERDVHLAELDDKERAYIAFCRSLARSRPRPSRAACDQLVALGYSRLAVHEMSYMIAMGCFYNRVSTLIICPPEQRLERLANGPLGYLVGLGARLMLPLWRGTPAAGKTSPAGAAEPAAGPFAKVLAPLAGLPGYRNLQQALESSFASDVLDRRTKALMFAVVARTLACTVCETQATDLLESEGVSQQETASALATLRADQLPAGEAQLLAWTRATVHYETDRIQQETSALAATIDSRMLLEAIGVASLANAMVRLAMLSE